MTSRLVSRRVSVAWLALISCALCIEPARAQDTSGVGGVRGRITDVAGNGTKDVVVCVAATGQCTTSENDGAFHIAVRTGTYRLDIVAPGQSVFVSDEIIVRAGLDSAIEVVLPKNEGLQESVTVTASASTIVPPQEVKNSGFMIGATEIEASAGALQDVSRYVQSLPGAVLGSDDFRNDLIVRGGSPLENLYVVDNIEIPNINSFANFASAGGTVSILDSQLIDNVTFLTGGYPAPYGNRTSSVLQIAQREGRRDGVAARATVGFAGAGGLAEGPIGTARKGSWILSARRSFLDVFTNDTGIGGVPVLYTVNVKAVYDLSPRDRVWAVNLTGVDRIRLGLTETTDLTSELSNLDINYQGWRTAAGVNWQRVFGTRAIGLLGVTHSRARVDQQVKDLLRNGLPSLGASAADQIAAGLTVFREQSAEVETAAKYDLTIEMPALGKVQAGGSVKAFNIDYDSASPFGNDSPFFITPDANPFTLQQNFSAWQTDAYLQTTRALGRLNVTGGGRVDRYQYIGATRFSPRLAAELRLTSTLSMSGSYGQYYQQPFFLFLSAFPENRSLKPFRANHYVGGLAWNPNAVTRVTAEVYRKNYSDYPVSSQIASLSLANIGDTFAVRDILFPLVSRGKGEATGVELNAQRKPGGAQRWDGEANLSFSRARYGGIDGVLRPGSFDYPVVANLVAGYRPSPTWRVGTRLAYLAGRPFTPFDIARSTAQRRAVYDLSQVNAQRSPDYFRLDLRVDRTFRAGERPVSIFAGVQNVTNRKNFASYSWDRRSNVIQTSDQLGVFPMLGLDWRF